jgi:membrane protein
MVIREAAEAFGNDDAGRMALAIAYRTLFSLSPLLLLATSIAGFLFRQEDTRLALVGQASTLLGETGAEIVEEALANTARAATATGVIGLALLVWTGSALFIEVRQSLNDIFRVPEAALPRGIVGFLKSRLVGFLAVLALGVLLVGLVALNLFVAGAERTLGDRIPWLDGLIPLGVPVISVLLLAILLALQFQWFTIRRIPWRAAWWGGAITALLLVLSGLGLGWYVSTRGEITAGAFSGGAIIVLFLVAALAQAYLFGAEVTRVLAGDRRKEKREPPAASPPAPARLATIAALGLGILLGRRRRL